MRPKLAFLSQNRKDVTARISLIWGQNDFFSFLGLHEISSKESKNQLRIAVDIPKGCLKVSLQKRSNCSKNLECCNA